MEARCLKTSIITSKARCPQGRVRSEAGGRGLLCAILVYVGCGRSLTYSYKTSLPQALRGLLCVYSSVFVCVCVPMCKHICVYVRACVLICVYVCSCVCEYSLPNFLTDKDIRDYS